MDMLFLGGVFPKGDAPTIYKKSKGVIQFAANVLQWNIINGLDECNNSPITILTSIFIGSYPNHYSDIYIRSSKWSHTKGADDRNIGFLNLFGIKQIFRGLSMSSQAKKWAERKTQEKKVIIIYSMHTPFMYAAREAKKIDPNINICLVCPDLPQYMNLDKRSGFIFNTLKSIDMYAIDKLLRCMDSFVLLTKYMAERIDVRGRPWIVTEGIANYNETTPHQKNKIKKDDTKVILYTGTLHKAYGIMDLLEAFKMIEDSSIRLWICGAGEAQLEVENLANNDSRVKYFGQVSRDFAVELQWESDLLINPRNNKGEYTKFSFPSKIMEYMCSGTPTLIYKLDGIPDQYYDYLLTIEGDTPEGIASSISQAFNKSTDELIEIGEKAKEFVLSNKNHIIQAQRIIELINKENRL